MKKIEIAYEILSESRRNFEKYSATGREFDMVHAHMYSIFECYAHGIIDWRTVEKKFQRSLKEYVNLYKDDKQTMLEEKARMLDEYTRVLEEYKPALDEYKRVHEQKMTSNIVIKKQISESVAQEQSNFYFNKRSLKESELKDITTLKTWKRVLENYPNLTAKDEQRVRMLTIFEGPTVDTTQLITSVVTEYGKKKKKKVKEDNIGRRERAPNGQMTGTTRGFTTPTSSAPRSSQVPQPRPSGSSVGSTEIAPNGQVTGTTRGPSLREPNAPLAPASSPRPQMRPANLGQRAAINRAVRTAMGEDQKSAINRAVRSAMSYADRDTQDRISAMTGGMNDIGPATDRRVSTSARAALDKRYPNAADARAANAQRQNRINQMTMPTVAEGAAEDYIVANAKERMADLEPAAREAFLAQLEKSYPGIRQKIGEGYKELPKMDRERYDELPGMEGPFMTMSGKVVYYDPKEGAYYDRDTDMYMSYEEFKALDNDRTGMKEAVAKIACLKCDEVSTAKAWEKNNGFCPKCKTSSQGVAESMNEAMSDEEVDAFHRALDALVHKYIGHGSHEKDDVDERKMTKKEKSKEKRLKKKYDDSDMKASMKKQYGDDWEQVYFATIRKQAMEGEGEFDGYDIMSEDPPNGIDFDYANLSKVNWDQYSKEDIMTFYNIVDNLDFEDGFDLHGDGPSVIHRDALIWLEKNVLGKMEAKRRPDHNMMAQARLQQIMQQAIEDSKRKRGLDDEDEKDRTDETVAGAFGAVAMPMGKMRRRKKTNEDQMMTEEQFDEAAGEKDACYHKVKSRYKVWPSAYASGALVQCRKVGAKNWGNKSKK